MIKNSAQKIIALMIGTLVLTLTLPEGGSAAATAEQMANWPVPMY